MKNDCGIQIFKCKKCVFQSKDLDEFANHMADIHLDVSYFPCSNCEDGIHNQCPCPCFCPCDTKD